MRAKKLERIRNEAREREHTVKRMIALAEEKKANVFEASGHKTVNNVRVSDLTWWKTRVPEREQLEPSEIKLAHNPPIEYVRTKEKMRTGRIFQRGTKQKDAHTPGGTLLERVKQFFFGTQNANVFVQSIVELRKPSSPSEKYSVGVQYKEKQYAFPKWKK